MALRILEVPNHQTVIISIDQVLANYQLLNEKTCPRCGRELSKANFISEQIESLGPTTAAVIVVCECGYLKEDKFRHH